ncbi:MAG: phosphate acyltransferase PlsX [Anaerovoracaceae bacterium]
MKIVLDGMGGDNAPEAAVKGAVEAAGELDDDTSIVIVGREDDIRRVLDETGYSGNRIEIVNATEVIENGEPPVKMIRKKKDSSIVKGLELVKNGEGDAFVSAGSTGAIYAGSVMKIGRIKGIDRPALATVYPVIGMQPSMLLDAGANADCRPEYLREFAVMGSIYYEKVLGVKDPTVGLINNGTEEGKGSELTKAAYKLISRSGVNFVGNVEARELQNHACDVIVTDGFTGNVIIKLTEGLGLMVLREMKSRFTSSMKSKLGAALLYDQLKGLKSEFDYSEYGGAPILGIKKAVVKAHGSSDPTAIKQTILKAVPFVRGNVIGQIEDSLRQIAEKAGDEEAEAPEGPAADGAGSGENTDD